MPVGVLFVMKTLEDQQQVVITTYKLAVFEIWEIFFALAYTYVYYASVLSLRIEYTDSMTIKTWFHVTFKQDTAAVSTP